MTYIYIPLKKTKTTYISSTVHGLSASQTKEQLRSITTSITLLQYMHVSSTFMDFWLNTSTDGKDAGRSSPALELTMAYTVLPSGSEAVDSKHTFFMAAK